MKLIVRRIKYLILLIIILLGLNIFLMRFNLFKVVNNEVIFKLNQTAVEMEYLHKNKVEEKNGADISRSLYDEYGFNATLSDAIPLNRSIIDTRYKECKEKVFNLTSLPKAAVVIIFHNERLSVLLRMVYGLLLRTPEQLLHEIILVDDASTSTELHGQLDTYLKDDFVLGDSRVRLIRLPQRKGIMGARNAGARASTISKDGAFIFLDAHFEVMHGWLPPLLEPIALDPKTGTTPIIDSLLYDTFAYRTDKECRGYFNWKMEYLTLILRKDELEHPYRNYEEYLMLGGAFAINVDFFWQLGGYDEGMEVYGAEQFEMSLKIWMCGGHLLACPCSRTAHLYRNPSTKGNRNLYGNYEFTKKNFRRFIDVWMDEEEREWVLQRRPHWRNVDPGDITDRLAIRERLQCKSFSWMLENVMPEVLQHFPPQNPDTLAYVQIRPFDAAHLCIFDYDYTKVALKTCESYFKWNYSWRGELQWLSGIQCLEIERTRKMVQAYRCHYTGGNQRWFYDRKKQWIMKMDDDFCLQANAANQSLSIATCDETNASLKWQLVGEINEQLMDEWEDRLRKPQLE